MGSCFVNKNNIVSYGKNQYWYYYKCKKAAFCIPHTFSEHEQSPAEVVLEAFSLESISSNSHFDEKPELLLLDYRLVFKNTVLFFSLIDHFYPHTVILLIVDQAHLQEAKRCKSFIHSFLSPNLDVLQLFKLIRNFSLVPPFVKSH